MDGACFAASSVLREGYLGMLGDEVRGVSEDLTVVGWFAEVDSGEVFQETVCSGIRGDNVETRNYHIFCLSHHGLTYVRLTHQKTM